MSQTIKICEAHDHRPTPMIFTFAFPRSEYWCPYCGHHGGFLGTGVNVPTTLELEATAMADESATQDYLRAIASLSACAIRYRGQWIAPGDLPPEEVSRLNRIIANFHYPAEREEA